MEKELKESKIIFIYLFIRSSIATRAQSGTRDDFTWHANKPKKFTKK